MTVIARMIRLKFSILPKGELAILVFAICKNCMRIFDKAQDNNLGIEK